MHVEAKCPAKYVTSWGYPLGPLHTQDWEHVTITLQALSLVEKVEPVQVRFTLCLRDQRSMRMQEWCKVYMFSYMASKHQSCFMVIWTIFKSHLSGSRSNTKPGDHGTPNAHNRWFILVYDVWGLALVELHWNNIRLRVWSHMNSHYTCKSVTTLHDFGGVLGRPPLDTSSFGLSQFHRHGSWLVCEVALGKLLVWTLIFDLYIW